MKTLKHNDAIKTRWPIIPMYGTVGTTDGYATECWNPKQPYHADTLEEHLAEAHARNVEHGHGNNPWTTKRATVIVDSKKYYEMERAWEATAVELLNGEVVEIEGARYTVKVLGDYMDFIHFTPVEEGGVS